MNSRYTLTVALLLSSLSYLAFAYQNECNDYDLCEYACRMSDEPRNDSINSDVKAGFAFYFAHHIPAKLECSFDLKGRIIKEVVKYIVRSRLTGDSLNLNIGLSPDVKVSVLSTDEALEVGYYAANDLLDHKSGSEVLCTAGKTYVREKIVSVLLWLLKQSNVENILPDQLTSSDLYNFLRKESARYAIDHFVVCGLCK